jgi:hypothetical protein
VGQLFDAIKTESEKSRAPANKCDERLRAHLGENGWKDLEKAAKDLGISNAVIHKVIVNSGFKISYTAIVRIRKELAEA